MKRSYLFTLLLLLSIVTGDSLSSQSLRVSGTARVGTLTRTAGTPAASYLLNENFEGTGYDSGAPSWNESGNTDEDYTGTVLKGSQSLRLHTSSSFIYKTFTSGDNIWAHARFRILTEGSVTAEAAIFLGNSGSTRECGFWLAPTTDEIFLRANGGNSSASATTYTSGTTYYVWLHFVRNGTCELFVSTSSTRPSSDGGGNVYLTKTGADTAVSSITLYNLENYDVVFDNVLVDDAEIGDNPNP